MGPLVEVRLAVPKAFADGTPMEGIRALEVYLVSAPAKEGQLPAAPPAATYFNKANRFGALTAAEVEERTRDGRAVLRYALEDLGAGDGHTGTFWGFLFIGPQGQRGVPSAQVPFLATPPLPPPSDFSSVSEEGGLRLAFVPPDGAKTLRVTRSLGDGPPVLLADLPGDARTLLDPNAHHGTEYTYAVQAASDSVHWSPAAELRAAYTDAFPPATPESAQYLPLGALARVRIAPAWGAVAYRIYRRCPGEEWALVAETPDAMAEVEASPCDFGAAAVDASGNQSPIVTARREEP